MSDRTAVIAELAEYARGSATAADLRADPGEVFGRPPLAGLMRFTQTLASRAELDALVADVAPLIRAADPFRGATVAINCGTLVEMGGDPTLVFPHLAAELPRHLALARRAHDRAAPAPGSLFDTDPAAAGAAAGLRFLMLATMAVICRQADFRTALRADRAVAAGVAALAGVSREAGFVAEVLGFTDGELLVLAPGERRGFRVRMEAVNFNAHLFTLLQAELIGGHLPGEPPDEEVVGVATGETPHQRLVGDHARFHFYTWAGLNPDGSLAATALDTWLPADGRPSEIPRIDGVPVALIGPPLPAARSWDSSLFANIHDALRSRAAVVEVLPDDRVAEWLDRIRAAPR